MKISVWNGELKNEAAEMVEQVEAASAKLVDLSLHPRAHIAE